VKTFGLAAFLVLSIAPAAAAQDTRSPAKPPGNDEDHAVVFEVGAVVDWERAEGSVHQGGTFAFEVTPIDNWLELEVGIAAVKGDVGVETSIDVLFKKPWRFSPRFEFMIGVGPEVVHASGPDRATFWGIEGVLDFMFWPRRNIGWYVEPGYEVTFRDGAAHHGIGISGGLLIGR
jgi:hypothetical protein